MDYYQILGVSRNATEEDISKAYRELARKWHPDMNPDKPAEATEKFKQISAAFEVLGDPSRKREYDQYGTTTQARPGRSHKVYTTMMDDFFRSNRSWEQEEVRVGDHILARVDINIFDVFKGGKVEMAVERMQICAACEGQGGKKVKCPDCDGAGSKTIYGVAMTVRVRCQSCGGEGKVFSEVCSVCNGLGLSQPQTETMTFNIPPGVQHGTKHVIRGKGQPSPGGINGDLVIVINVVEDDLFHRNGNDVYVFYPCTYSELVLGTTIEVPTLEGVATVKVPAGTQPGSKLRLRAKGLPKIKSVSINGSATYGRGDQIVQLELEVPTDVEDLKELFNKLVEAESGLVTPLRQEFKNKMEHFHERLDK